jgi:hypothetical protein
LAWAAYDIERRLTMELNETSRILEDPYAIERGVLSRLFTESWDRMGL